jgi:hypothetical protein
MGARVMAAAIAMLLVVSGVGGGVAGLGSQSAEAAEQSCERAQHDGFMHDSLINEFNNESTAKSSVRNTDVVLEDAEAFVRVKMANPNGYCVSMVIEVDQQIVAPADLGQVDAANATVDEPPAAEWRAVQNLETGETRTVIRVDVPPGSSITYAPSKARVKSLSWTGEAKNKGSEARERLGELFGYEYDLEQNEYVLERPTDRRSTTVQLTNDDGRKVDEWHATYTTVDGETRPVKTDSSAPVYYRKEGDTVRFEWASDSQANVTFVANPGPVDKFTHSSRAYWSTGGWLSDRLDGLFGAVTIAPRGGVA